VEDRGGVEDAGFIRNDVKATPMPIRYIALPTSQVRALQRGDDDANGRPPELHVSDGDGAPCRHCLRFIEKGEPYLIVGYRPFETVQPYAEIGPLFLHAVECARAPASGRLPEILQSESYILRGYDAAERIVYGTGGVIARERIGGRAETLLADPAIAFVDVRSAQNNCFQCRVVRAD